MALTEGAQARKLKELQKSIKALNKSKVQSPVEAIRLHCRQTCGAGECRNGRAYKKATLSCKATKCFLYPYRNGNPKRMIAGMKKGAPDLVKYNTSNNNI